MKKLFSLIVLLVIITLSGCTARGCASFDREYSGEQKYYIEQYSGGKLIATYNFTGVLNNEDSSDGFYFFMGDTLVEVTGDLIIKSTK